MNAQAKERPETDDEILRRIQGAEATVAIATKNIKAAKAELLSRRKDEIAKLLKENPEPFGGVTLTVGNHQIKVTTPKKVTWSQPHLKTIAKQMVDGDVDPELYIKIEYDINETVYKNWPQEMRDYFADARTVEPGTVSMKIVEDKQ